MTEQPKVPLKVVAEAAYRSLPEKYESKVEACAQALYEDAMGSTFPIPWSALPLVERVVWRRKARPAVDWCERVEASRHDEIELAASADQRPPARGGSDA